MAGFFRQLAQQALQPALRLHSTAALPYSQVQESGIEVLETGLPISNSRHSERSEESAVRSVLPPAPEQQTSRLRLGMADENEPPIGQPDRNTDEPPLPRPAVFRPSSAPDRQALAGGALEASQTRISIVPHAAPRVEQHKADNVATPSERPAVLQPKILRPAPPAIRPQRPPSQSEFAPSQRRTAPAPEVHIHIGRIELTAVPPPAAPRRESASGKKPMSLDEYLQRRRKAP